MKKFALLLCFVMMFSILVGCKDPNSGKDDPTVDDLTENVVLKMNYAAESADRTMTYNKSNALVLIDGETVISSGALKPMWQYVEKELNITFNDVTNQNQKASQMIETAAANQFKDAVVFGGNSILEELNSYGTKGYFIDLNDELDAGNMPNFKAYLDKNPSIKTAITSYDGGIYAVPYIAEIGTYARAVHMRETWVTTLLDTATSFDTTTVLPVVYTGNFVGANARTGANGGTVTPKNGISITKKTNQNVIELQNQAAGTDGLDGNEAVTVLRKYIEDNYDYANPSELYLGEKAAYDMDELIALLRCVKANPVLLTNGKASTVTPFFVRQTSYREDLLRFATYLSGCPVFGSDSYGARWAFDKDGNLIYTYYQEEMFNALEVFSELYAEGLIHQDFHNKTDKTNYRNVFYGSDKAATNPAFGFMTFDWIASTTADSLNDDVVTTLPPVAKINGVWQYYIENSRVLKPDGWAISSKATRKEQLRAVTLFDYFFSEEGHLLQNYGLPDIISEETITGPDGKVYPKYKSWVLEKASELAKGDLSTFLRDWLGCQMPIGYQKEIGFEYQYTSQRGFEGWELLNNSTCYFATYGGEGIPGTNPNYYKLVPTFFSFTERQKGALKEQVTLDEAFFEMMFNVIRYLKLDPNKPDITLPKTFAEYKQLFDDNGVAVYIKTYNDAYDAMTA